MVPSTALEASVLEVKVLEGLGTTIDIVLVQGELKEGDTLVVSDSCCATRYQHVYSPLRLQCPCL